MSEMDDTDKEELQLLTMAAVVGFLNEEFVSGTDCEDGNAADDGCLGCEAALIMHKLGAFARRFADICELDYPEAIKLPTPPHTKDTP